MSQIKTKIKDTLHGFLFNHIAADSDYQNWAESFVIPEYITDNLAPSKKLRDYQENALKHFIYLYEHDPAAAKHLLFNMATGTGKTLVMAAAALYLYEQGYRHFVFLVHRTQIIRQAVKNFTDYKFDKYLFNPKGLKIHGRTVNVRQISRLQDAGRNDLNFMFMSTPLLYNHLRTERENGLTATDFSKNDFVIFADEAHRLNVDTRDKKKKDAEEATNWERAVLNAVRSRPENLLLEFTATVDLANEKIHTKYQDKLVYRYDFLSFNRDGYSKDVKFLYNDENNIVAQKRLLIVNAVALSEFRRLFAERTMKTQITPIVLIKSALVKKSEEDRKFFDEVIATLRPKDLGYLQQVAAENRNHEHEIISDMFRWLTTPNRIGIDGFISSIREGFAHENTLIYNNQEKERADLLPQLDHQRNRIRAIFSVNALNEGWDVLSLFDIVHFDVSANKNVSLQDIQLIGRGARYCPYEVPKGYVREKAVSIRDINRPSAETDRHKRKFDDDPRDAGRVLETLFYHFVETGFFAEKLQKELLGEGIVNEAVDQRTIALKPHFLASDTYKRGFVLVNKPQTRPRMTVDEIDTTFNKTLKASLYNLHAEGLTDKERNFRLTSKMTKTIRVTEDFFSMPIIRKALMSAENGFFRFNNLRQHLVGITSVDDLIEKYLPKYQIHYEYGDGKDIEALTPDEKLQLLRGEILPEARKLIDLKMPKIVGSNQFRPVPLAEIFRSERTLYLTAFPVVDTVTGKRKFITSDERAQAQSDHHDADLQYNVGAAQWYAYSENYGTGEEKKFIKFMAAQIANLQAAYPGAEIYVIRNELDYFLFNPLDGRRFSPDYLLIINDVPHKEMYYQCVIEAKGGHLLDKDKWKEEALIAINEKSEVVFDADTDDDESRRQFIAEVKHRGYREIKNIGIKFYNTNPRNESEFAVDFKENVLRRQKK